MKGSRSLYENDEVDYLGTWKGVRVFAPWFVFTNNNELFVFEFGKKIIHMVVPRIPPNLNDIHKEDNSPQSNSVFSWKFFKKSLRVWKCSSPIYKYTKCP